MTQTYATQTTAYLNGLIAAEMAGGAKVDLMTNTVLVVGDGNGAVPTLSALIAAGGVTHEVWRGQAIQGVSVDPDAANQIDVAVDIPAAIGGAEIGPFTVREFAILDATGACCIVGTTNLEKTVSSQGQTSDLAWTAAVVVASADAVVVTPPTAGYATMAQAIAGYNANLPDCTAPLTKTDTAQANGWLKRVFGAAAATLNALGVGRPATDAEFAAGQAADGGFAYPWPTLQQVSAALAALATAIAALPTTLGAYLPLAGGTMQGALSLFADPTAAAHAATKRYVDAAIAALTAALDAYLPLAGGTMLGWLTLKADPTQGLHAATKQYVDNKFYSGGQLPIGAVLTAVQIFCESTGQAPAVGNTATSQAGSFSTGVSNGSVTSNATLMPAGQTWKCVGNSRSQDSVTLSGGGQTLSYTVVSSTWMRTA